MLNSYFSGQTCQDNFSKQIGGFKLVKSPKNLFKYSVSIVSNRIGSFQRSLFLSFLIIVFLPSSAFSQRFFTPTPGGGYTVRDTFNSSNQQTVTPTPGGGFMIRDTFNPGNQQTITPTPDGGFIIRDTFNSGNQQTLTPNLSGGFIARDSFGGGNQRIISTNGIGGYSIQDPFNSANNQSISPEPNGGFSIRNTFNNNLQQQPAPIHGNQSFRSPIPNHLSQMGNDPARQSFPLKPQNQFENNSLETSILHSSPSPTDYYQTEQFNESYFQDQIPSPQSGSPEDVDEIWNRAQLLMEQKDFRKAKRLFQTLIERDPPIIPAYNQLGYILAEIENDPESAFLMFEEGFIKGDESPQAIQNLALSYFTLGNLGHAASFTRLFFNQGYCSTTSMEILAKLAKTTEESKEAITIIEKVPERFSQKRDQLLGRLYFLVGNFASATTVLEMNNARGLNEIDEVALLAISQHIIGKTTESIRTTDELSRICPEKGEKLIELLSQISVDKLIGRESW